MELGDGSVGKSVCSESRGLNLKPSTHAQSWAWLWCPNASTGGKTDWLTACWQPFWPKRSFWFRRRSLKAVRQNAAENTSHLTLVLHTCTHTHHIPQEESANQPVSCVSLCVYWMLAEAGHHCSSDWARPPLSLPPSSCVGLQMWAHVLLLFFWKEGSSLPASDSWMVAGKAWASYSCVLCKKINVNVQE